jgi:putative DNA-invertase from lambdoid prophage Rac
MEAPAPACRSYGRVSTDGQAESGLGLEAQEATCRRYFEYRLAQLGFTWGGFYEDAAVSGAKPLLKRPAGARLDADLKAGDAVVVGKLDRAFRDVVDCLQTINAWQARGVRIHICDLGVDTTTDVGQLILTVMAAVARFERSRIGERIRQAFESIRRRGGRVNGQAGYGFRWKDRRRRVLEEDAEGRVVMAEIVCLKRQGLTWEQLELRLRTTGALTAAGRPWSVGQIRRAYQAELRLRELEVAHDG